MTTEETVIVRYSMVINPVKDATEEEFTRKARMALANLFSSFSYLLRNGEDVDFTADHEIELSSKTEHWDTTLVLKLIKVNKNNDN